MKQAVKSLWPICPESQLQHKEGDGLHCNFQELLDDKRDCTGLGHLQKPGRSFAPEAAMEKHPLQQVVVVGSRNNNARRRRKGTSSQHLLHLKMLEQTLGMSEQKLTGLALNTAGKESQESCMDE